MTSGGGAGGAGSSIEWKRQRTAVTVIAGPPMATVVRSGGGDEADASVSTREVDGEWDVACESKRGDRWCSIASRSAKSAARRCSGGRRRTARPRSEDAVYTAVADCGAKSIEANWPGKRTVTRAGTCGRYLVDAVCAARAHSRSRAKRGSAAT